MLYSNMLWWAFIKASVAKKVDSIRNIPFHI